MHELAITPILAKPSRKVKARLEPASKATIFGPETRVAGRIAPSVEMGIAIVERMSPIRLSMTQFKSGINEILVPRRRRRLVEKGEVLTELVLVNDVTPRPNIATILAEVR